MFPGPSWQSPGLLIDHDAADYRIRKNDSISGDETMKR
jgi:hypothetical protein